MSGYIYYMYNFTISSYIIHKNMHRDNAINNHYNISNSVKGRQILM